MPRDRLTPAPGAKALELRQLCDRLTRSVATIARHGIQDFTAIDAASADFLLAIVRWEIATESAKPALWCYVLSAFNDVRRTWREASRCAVVDGEEWKRG